MQVQSPLQGLHEALQNAVKESFGTQNVATRKESSSVVEELITKLHSHSTMLKQDNAPPSRLTDQMYKIRNLDTGEELDLRDENKEDFVKKLAQLLSANRFSEALEEF